jgi:hypothetical protein
VISQTPTTIVSPTKQAAMALSRFYTEGLQKGGMPQGFGHCQRFRSKNPVRLNMVQKGEYWFPKGSPLRYKERNYKKRISDVWVSITVYTCFIFAGIPPPENVYIYENTGLHFWRFLKQIRKRIGSKLTVFYKNGYHFTKLTTFYFENLPENVKI